MDFTKMHGIGNDFVMINCLGTDTAELQSLIKKHAAFICDRKFGVGGDGVILILCGEKTRFRMQMFNPDGSEAEMCGNGIRCFAKFVYDAGLNSGESALDVETGAGTLAVVPILNEHGAVTSVRVDMGQPILIPEDVPTTLGNGRAVDVALKLNDITINVTAVSMGNPHAVTYVSAVEDYPVETIGRQVENHPAFPKRTNTEFIEVLSPTEINFRVWERGAGETLACGTGACAAVVASVLNEKTARTVTVHLPGGDLNIEWSELDNHVYMTGPAETVYSGTVCVPTD